jgi:hypothetical protein
VDEGNWVYKLNNETNKMKRYIPNLGLHDYEAVLINMSVGEVVLPISFSNKVRIKRYESSIISESYQTSWLMK